MKRQPLINWHQEVYVTAVERIIEQVDIVQTTHGHRIAWVDVRGQQVHMNVTRAIIDRYEVDMVATIIPKGILLGGAGIDRGIDLSPLHGTHEYQGHSFTIAGHRSPVHISPSTRQVTQEFISALANFIRGVL